MPLSTQAHDPADELSVPTRLRMTRTIKAPPERVFDAWINPELRKQWWSARPGMICDRFEIEPRVGGAYRINMWTPDRAHEYVTVGEIREFDPPRRLAMTWTWEAGNCGNSEPPNPGASARDTLLEIDFLPDADGGTLLTLTHSRFDDQPQRDDHHGGWTGCLASLQKMASGH